TIKKSRHNLTSTKKREKAKANELIIFSEEEEERVVSAVYVDVLELPMQVFELYDFFSPFELLSSQVIFHGAETEKKKLCACIKSTWSIQKKKKKINKEVLQVPCSTSHLQGDLKPNSFAQFGLLEAQSNMEDVSL
ncbi:hypothetical protein RFI_36471, partial [Reticulomyxa filosa]